MRFATISVSLLLLFTCITIGIVAGRGKFWIVETKGKNGLPEEDKHQNNEDNVAEHNDYYWNLVGPITPAPPVTRRTRSPFCQPGLYWC